MLTVQFPWRWRWRQGSYCDRRYTYGFRENVHELYMSSALYLSVYTLPCFHHAASRRPARQLTLGEVTCRQAFGRLNPRSSKCSKITKAMLSVGKYWQSRCASQSHAGVHKLPSKSFASLKVAAQENSLRRITAAICEERQAISTNSSDLQLNLVLS